MPELDLDIDLEPNPVEVGKMLMVFSLALLIFSVQGFYSMRSVEGQINDSEQTISEGLSHVNSAESQRIIDALQDVQGISQEFQVIEQGFNNAQAAIGSAEAAKEEVRSTKENYQWMVVASILGAVAGLMLILLGRE